MGDKDGTGCIGGIQRRSVPNWKRLGLKAQATWTLVKHYPSTAVYPLLVLAVLLAISIWGVSEVAKEDEDSNKNLVKATAKDAAMAFQSQLTQAYGPVVSLMAMVQYSPQYDIVQEWFHAISPTLMSQVPQGSVRSIQLAPNGIIKLVEPLEGNSAALDLNLFNGTERDGALKTVADGVLTLVGPMPLRQGGFGVRVRMPIFIPNSSASDTFGGPPGPYDCPADVCYNAATRSRFWGFATGIIDLDALATGSDSRLTTLARKGYRYQLAARQVAPAGAGGGYKYERISGERERGAGALATEIELHNSAWTLFVWEEGGWTPDWYAPVLAAVIIASFVIAGLHFGLLVAWRQHQMLLEALLPKGIIKRLRSGGSSQLGDAYQFTADTPADTILRIMGGLLEGRMPDLRDVVLVRTAIRENYDIYQPLDLGQQLREANMDAEVARALMRQLGQDIPSFDHFERNTEFSNAPDGRDALSLSKANTGSADGGDEDMDLHASTAETALHACHTINGALSLLMTPLPAIWTPALSPGPAAAFTVAAGSSSVSLIGRRAGVSAAGGGDAAIAAAVATATQPTVVVPTAPPAASTAAVDAAAPCEGADFLPSPFACPVDPLPASLARDHSFGTGGSQDGSISTVGPAGGLAGAGAGALGGCSLGTGPHRTGSAPSNMDSMGGLGGIRLALRSPPGGGGPGGGAAAGVAVALTAGGGAAAPSAGGPQVNGCGSPLVSSPQHIASSTRLGGGGQHAANGGNMLTCARGASSTYPQPQSRLAHGSVGSPAAARGLGPALLQLQQQLSAGGGDADYAQRRTSTAGSDATMASRRAQRALALPPPPALVDEAERVLAGADAWHFDVFRLEEATQGHALSCLAFYLIQRANLIRRFSINPLLLARFLRHVEAGYLPNPYHNAAHAADVLHVLHVVLHRGQLTVHYVDHLGLMAAYLAAVVHDYGHLGLTNDYLVASSAPLAVRYNDRSPMENHHCAAAFSALHRPELNWLEGLSAQEQGALRKQVIEMVMATDMKQHFQILSHFKTVHSLGNLPHHSQLVAQLLAQHRPEGPAAASSARPDSAGGGGVPGPGPLATAGSAPSPSAPTSATALSQHPPPLRATASGATSMKHTQSGGAAGNGPPAVDLEVATAAAVDAPKPIDETERLLTLQVVLKCADLCNLAAESSVYQKWVMRLEEEFFLQGDKEREAGMAISPLFDRYKQGVSKSQVGFFDFVALPLVSAACSAFKGMMPMLEHMGSNYHAAKEKEEAAKAKEAEAAAKRDISNAGAAAAAAAAAAGNGSVKQLQVQQPQPPTDSAPLSAPASAKQLHRHQEALGSIARPVSARHLGQPHHQQQPANQPPPNRLTRMPSSKAQLAHVASARKAAPADAAPQ